MKIRVQKDGRITLPKKLRTDANIREGQWLQIDFQGGHILLRPEDDAQRGLRLSETHPIWELVGKWRSGRSDISSDKYSHLAQAYESQD